MSDTQVHGNTGLLDLSAQTGAQKAGEFFVSRALNGLVDGVKKGYSGAQVLLGSAFSRYLSNATLRYNQVRTLATGPNPRTIIGPGNVYVSIGVRHGKKRIETTTVDELLRVNRNVLILGTGGIGKSMLMRYLFLNTAHRGEYVPVLLELRKVSSQSVDKISILDLIYSCMNDFDVQMPRDQFEYSLRLGKYLFLMDGFDEVKESHALETAAAIQAFCAKYPKNPCIITSRPRRDTSPLETFTSVESLPLTQEQAIQLSSKIWAEDEKTREFCRQLENGLYKKHKDFAENPLLLSMMFLTFMRNNSVPNHLAEFYSKAYDALYSAHDSNDKGYYRREFHCKDLDETGFRLLLSHFCFRTYFKEDYEFSKESILFYIDASIKKLGLSNISASDYLDDLRNVVCIIVEDGDIFRFSHRSFQTYFAACYTSNILTDEQQKKLFAVHLTGSELFWEKDDYYELLSQIEPQRFAVNALEEELRSIQTILRESDNPDILYLKMQYSSFSITKRPNGKESIAIRIGNEDGSCRYYNIISIFETYVKKYSDIGLPYRKNQAFIISYIEKLAYQLEGNKHVDVPFSYIDSTEVITDGERNALYSAFVEDHNVCERRKAIDLWLDEVENKRNKLSSADFIDDL